MQSYGKYLNIGHRYRYLMIIQIGITFSIYMVVAVPFTVLITAFKVVAATARREPAPAARVVTALRTCVRAFLAAVVAIHVVVTVGWTAFFFAYSILVCMI